MTDQFDPPKKDVERDRWKRPLIIPRGQTKPVGYSRASSYGDIIDDRFNLEKWVKRMVAIGMSKRPDLQLAAVAHADNKKEMDGIAEQAMQAAQAGARATIGTAVHSLTEKIDRGESLPDYVPEAALADLEAYRVAMERSGFEVLDIETFVATDDLPAAGTFDRRLRYHGKPVEFPNGVIEDGTVIIGDLKTSGSISFGGTKFGAQFAIYAHGEPYDWEGTTEDTRRPGWGEGGQPNQQRAIVVWLPAGEANCQIKWVDIEEGWKCAKLSQTIRAQRRFRDWYVPFEYGREATPSGTTFAFADDDEFITRATFASTVELLYAIHAEATAVGKATPELTTACARRKAALGG